MRTTKTEQLEESSKRLAYISRRLLASFPEQEELCDVAREAASIAVGVLSDVIPSAAISELRGTLSDPETRLSAVVTRKSADPSLEDTDMVRDAFRAIVSSPSSPSVTVYSALDESLVSVLGLSDLLAYSLAGIDDCTDDDGDSLASSRCLLRHVNSGPAIELPLSATAWDALARIAKHGPSTVISAVDEHSWMAWAAIGQSNIAAALCGSARGTVLVPRCLDPKATLSSAGFVGGDPVPVPGKRFRGLFEISRPRGGQPVLVATPGATTSAGLLAMRSRSVPCLAAFPTEDVSSATASLAQLDPSDLVAQFRNHTPTISLESPRPPLTCRSTDSLCSAADALLSTKAHCIWVLDQSGSLKGAFYQFDLLVILFPDLFA